MTNQVAVIVVAGGAGKRMGVETPKQFLDLGGKPILMHTLERFAEVLENRQLIVVLPSSHIPYWEMLCEEHNFTLSHTVCEGGDTRFDSVKRGLEQVDNALLVAVHDGVRPLVSRAVIQRAVADAKVFGAVIPVVRPLESMREVGEDRSRKVDRDRYRIVQTPQVFKTALLKRAYGRDYDPSFTDDATVVESTGHEVFLCEGDYANIKITTPVDLLTAEALLKA